MVPKEISAIRISAGIRMLLANVRSLDDEKQKRATMNKARDTNMGIFRKFGNTAGGNRRSSALE